MTDQKSEKDALIERIKSVLDFHQFNAGGPGVDASCYGDDCGWTHPWDRPTHEMWEVHRAHVAGQITIVIPSVVNPPGGRSAALLDAAEALRQAERDGYLFLDGSRERVPWEAVARWLEARADGIFPSGGSDA